MSDLSRIETLLEEILTVLKSSGAGTEDIPWPMKLIQEYQMGVDLDDNGLVYGVDYIFAEHPNGHPTALATIGRELNNLPPTSKRLTFIEYAESLPVGTQRRAVIDWCKSKL